MKREESRNSRWTDSQWEAIASEGQNLLVAAAAGSGKTAVLVERIIRKITDPDQHTDLDNLLVVTFTKAAAAEMKERISRAIEQRLSENPADLFLRRQQALLGRASIMTLHAFCRSVIRDYYYLLDLDPSFRLIDEAESALIRDEVLDQVLEDNYATGDPAFFRTVDRYSGDRSDEALRRLIFRLYDFSVSNPWPEQWLDRIVQNYRFDDQAHLDSLGWIAELKRTLSVRINEAKSVLRAALDRCNEPGGPSVYAETLTSDLTQLNHLPEPVSAPWESLRTAFSGLSFRSLKKCTDRTVDQRIKDSVKKDRDQIKKMIAAVQTEWFRGTETDCLNELKEMADSVAVLRQITGEFSRSYTKEKRRKSLLDFADLEHQCLAILRDPQAKVGDERPSEVARHFRAKFSEVLIDEYQDTNRVQEAIIRLITRDESAGGNLFMVGDVKQSIYGFRLADPGLFLSKYKKFSAPESVGRKIDLSSNFRSRSEIIDGTNFVFRQLMDEAVGGIDYDQAAELRYGADYPSEDSAVELDIIDRSGGSEDAAEDDRDLIEIEAEAIAGRILAMIGDGKHSAYPVYDPSTRIRRAIRYRDIAILVRAAGSTAAVLKETLEERGIPAYAELSKGYFDTIEVIVMLSVLQIIDNPHQDIPLTSVLHSPIGQFTAEDLAAIRLVSRQTDFFDALTRYQQQQSNDLSGRIAEFLQQLNKWRNLSKAASVSQLIWQIFRDSGYFDYAGGLAGGTQRQANLQALYDRARQYEKTSFRGLFRFLRFIHRLRETGGDMGEARALSEQADVVRIMTIHKSKGLEFPVVFIAGLGKRFNMKDTAVPVLLHREMGLGTRWIDPERRISLPSLLYAAIKERIRRDELAEEMRILYVAMTRAKEKLILCGSVRNLPQSVGRWQSALHQHQWILSEDLRRGAAGFLDWIGPAVIRHHSAEVLHEAAGEQPDRTTISTDRSSWIVRCLPANSIVSAAPENTENRKERLERIRKSQPIPSFSGLQDEVADRLNWVYPADHATKAMAKQTVTEIKVQQDYFSEGQDDQLLHPDFQLIGGERPRFFHSQGLSAAERGTAVHLLMQHLRLKEPLDEEEILRQAGQLIDQEILTADQAGQIDYSLISRFFASPIGRQMLTADALIRECPFSLVVDAAAVYPGWKRGNGGEEVLIQGVIDCLIEDSSGLTLLDYKTDHLAHLFPDSSDAARELKRRYRVQISLYRTAIERIWKRHVVRAGLYSFDCGLYVDLSSERGVFE